MFPVYLFNDREKGNIGINTQEFQRRFRNICERHRIEKRARVFAFILTDFNTMEANHFILNEQYWNKMHTLSGDYITVFHLDFNSSDVNQLFRTGRTKLVQEHYSKFFSGLSKLFGVDNILDFKMPAVLFFQTEKAEILDFFCVELKSNELQKNMND